MSKRQGYRRRRKKRIMRILRKVFLIIIVIFLAIAALLLSQSMINMLKTGDLKVPITFGMADIVLDAGHGGKDPGAESEAAYEKDINLEVAKKVQVILEEQGYKVAMTRSDDTYVRLQKRIEYANKKAPKAFVSIHCNSSEESANGIETFYAETKEAGSLELSECIHRKVIEQTQARDREVKTADYAVILETDMPAALIEVGFLNNSNEQYLLQTEDYQNKLARGIADGILEYLDSQKE